MRYTGVGPRDSLIAESNFAVCVRKGTSLSGRPRFFHMGRGITTFVAATALLAAVSGCAVTFKPKFVPIVVSVNERGDLSVRYDGQFVTPIGTFTLDISPGYGLDEGDVLLEVLHDRDGVHVKSLFLVHEIGVRNVGMTVSGGSGVRETVDEDKTTIEIPPGAQEFTLEVDDEEAVEVPETTSVTEWVEPPPTTTQPEPTSTSESTTTESSDVEPTDVEPTDEEPTDTEPPDESVSAELPPVGITTTA